MAFCLVGGSGEVLMYGLPCAGKIAAQAEVMHVRSALAETERVVPHRNAAGRHFAVIKDKAGEVLGKTPEVDSEGELATIVRTICEVGARATIIDATKRVARKGA
ncbi:MAG: hypothetical protein U1E73_04770 [Planctomycetota bacterium]